MSHVIRRYARRGPQSRWARAVRCSAIGLVAAVVLVVAGGTGAGADTSLPLPLPVPVPVPVELPPLPVPLPGAPELPVSLPTALPTLPTDALPSVPGGIPAPDAGLPVPNPASAAARVAGGADPTTAVAPVVGGLQSAERGGRLRVRRRGDGADPGRDHRLRDRGGQPAARGDSRARAAARVRGEQRWCRRPRSGVLLARRHGHRCRRHRAGPLRARRGRDRRGRRRRRVPRSPRRRPGPRVVHRWRSPAPRPGCSPWPASRSP